MGKKEITRTALIYICERCGYEWETRLSEFKLPLYCPKCKSPSWNKKRINKIKNE